MQLRYRKRPIQFGRSLRAPSGAPQFVSESGRLVMPDSFAMHLLAEQVGLLRMFAGAGGLFLSGWMILFPAVLRGGAVRMSCLIV